MTWNEQIDVMRDQLVNELYMAMKKYVVEDHCDTFAYIFSEALLADCPKAHKIAWKESLNESHAYACLDDTKQLKKYFTEQSEP